MNSAASFGTLCPSADQLRSFIRGDTERGLELSLQSHLAECESCRQRAESLRVSTIELTDRLTESAAAAAASTLDGLESPRPDARKAAARPSLENRYRLGAEIARGGMGVVHRATDLHFHREVAVKLLRPRWREETDLILQAHKQAQALEAFQYEAEITARLQHPGIPPVHELGTLENGLPFLAMKLIQGQTLHELLHARSSLLAELPRWLSIFEQIAQAVGYAHAQGILHRDLKPLNVMVGQFGEVQVMDWGLAKIVGQPEQPGFDAEEEDTDVEADAELNLSKRPSTCEPRLAPRQFVSRLGDVKGTLQYMAPEQARGEIHELDARADVFGLGGVLCQILIGQAPYSQQAREELKQAAASGDVQAAVTQINSCGADAGIVELAIRCLSPEKDQRPANGTAVAQAVADHRASVEQRLRQAETERALSQQRLVEQARRRKLWYAVTAALILLVIGTSSAVFIIADRERIALDQAAISEAVNAFLQDDLLSLAGADEQADAGVKVDADLKVRDLVLRAAKKIEGQFKNQPRVEAEVRMTIGKALYSAGETELAIAQMSKAHALRLQLHGPDHRETLKAANGLASVLLEGGRIKEAVLMFEENLARHQAAGTQDGESMMVCMANLTTAYNASGQTDKAIQMGEKIRDVRQKKQGPTHPDTLDSMFTLGNAYLAAGRFEDARAIYESTLQQREKAFGPEDPRSIACLSNLGIVLFQLGKVQEAIPLLEKVLRSREKSLGADHPETLQAMINVANMYQQTGRLSEALPLMEDAMRRSRAKLGAEHPDTLRGLMNLAGAYVQSGKVTEGLKLFEEALPLQEKALGDDHPHVLQMLNNLAATYLKIGRTQDAVRHFEKLLELSTKKLGPDAPEMVITLSNLATVYSQSGLAEEAIPLAERAVKLGEAKLGAEHPSTISALGSLATAYFTLQRVDEAIPIAERAYGSSQKVNGAEHEETIETGYTLSNMYLLKGRFQESAGIAEKTWKVREATLGPAHVHTLRNLLALAVAETYAKQYAAAEKHLKLGYATLTKSSTDNRKELQAAFLQSFIELYDHWGKEDDATTWREQLKKLGGDGTADEGTD